MYCKNCGKEILDEVKYCPHCGFQLKPLETPNNIPPILEEDQQELPNDLGIGDGTDFQDDQYGIPQIPLLEKGLPYTLLASGAVGFLLLIPFLLERLIELTNAFGIQMPYSLQESFTNLSIFLASGIHNLSWIILAGCVLVLVEQIYLFLRRKKNDRTLPSIAILATISSILGALAYIFQVAGVIKLFFFLVSTILGIDLFINIFLEKKELHGTFNLSDDFALLKQLFLQSNTVDSAQYTDPNIPTYELTQTHELKDSYFDGSGFGLFLRSILLIVVSAMSFSLLTPWCLVWILNWKTSHTVIEGRRQKFNGTGLQLFGLWIKWVVLTLITCGIYSLFAYVDYQKWVTRHISYEDIPHADNTPFPFSFFDGNTAEFIGYSILHYLITTFTFGLGSPWGLTMLHKWRSKSTVVESERYFYDGTGIGLFGTYLLVVFLSLITCGLYIPWGVCRIHRYVVNHTHIDALNRMS